MNLSKINKDLTKINNTLTKVTSVVATATIVGDYASQLTTNKSDWVSVPELYLKDYQICVNDAIEILDDLELKSTKCKMNIADADSKYRNCIAYQVISTKPRAKEKVPKGTYVYVKYITPEVIEESNRLFIESKLLKEQLRLEKIAQHNKHREHRKESQIKVLNSVKGVPERLFHKNVDSNIMLIETKEDIEDEQTFKS